MIAVRGLYDNGRIQLTEDAPMGKADVIVIFTEVDDTKGERMPKETAKDLFDEFTGSIKRIIDEKSERLGALEIANVNWKDLEDGLQMQCASQEKLDYIVTRNIKDFKSSSVLPILPEQLIELYNALYEN